MPSYDIVFFTLFRTDNPYSSISLSMAKELAKRHRVFYVNHPYSLKDIVTGLKNGEKTLRERLPQLLTGRTRYEKLESIPENFLAVQPPATLPINWLPKGGVYNLFQKINNNIVLGSIRKVLKDHNVCDFVFINCYDPFFAGFLPENFGARLSIYHCIDDITQNAYTHKHGTDLEIEACRRADLTLVTSTNLYQLRKPYAKNIETYFNAADNSVFEQVLTQRFDPPSELNGRNGKVIGFVGNLDELRIDYPLLKKVAEAHPDKTLLLVGPVNSPEPHAIGLNKMPNVIFAGSRRLAELPPLVQHMDVVLIPFLCNTLTRSIYPLKINEYLAAGKSVVSTTFSEDIRTFGHVISLAENHEDFVQQINHALSDNSSDKIAQRVSVAAENTWTARIEQLYQLVEKYAPTRQ